MEDPSELYEDTDGTTKQEFPAQYCHILQHSLSSAFFAYIPVYMWVKVVRQTNKAMREYERAHRITEMPLFTLQEIMKKNVILFYMELVHKGVYANYWGQ
ncbi:hypothetical protein JG687_00003459 [Phytophthora cactorum]|uniref:PiggyBac transposable element-derived protein domain-containing protein n=1 Tax=Phytophthora cactorum TaxID=29920 RepID=A0A8T1URF1_9STRA|nr:hypothetical protein JG687_00003459 [Phytophthora cactorum]